jgi:hypothetical protein
MNINTFNKRFLGWSKFVQGSGHKLLIVHFCPYGNQLISQLCGLVQIAHLCICVTHVDGWKLVSQEHLFRDTASLI